MGDADLWGLLAEEVGFRTRKRLSTHAGFQDPVHSTTLPLSAARTA